MDWHRGHGLILQIETIRAKMVNKTCVYRDCKSDSRSHPWLIWSNFIKPTLAKNKKRAERWVQLVGRDDFTVDNITQDTYICEKHFSEEDHESLNWKRNLKLDPFPAGVLPVNLNLPKPNPNYDLTDLSEFLWFLCPDDKCVFKSKDQHVFEKHMRDMHDTYKGSEMIKQSSGARQNTMLIRNGNKAKQTGIALLHINADDVHLCGCCLGTVSYTHLTLPTIYSV